MPELFGENGYHVRHRQVAHAVSWLRAFQRGKTIMFGGMSDHGKVPVQTSVLTAS